MVKRHYDRNPLSPSVPEVIDQIVLQARHNVVGRYFSTDVGVPSKATYGKIGHEMLRAVQGHK